MANGDTFRHMVLQAMRLASFIGGMAVGGTFWGVQGLLLGIVVSRVFEYGATIMLTRKYGVWLPKLDGAAFALLSVVVAIAAWRHGV